MDRFMETNGIRLHYLEYGSGDHTMILARQNFTH